MAQSGFKRKPICPCRARGTVMILSRRSQFFTTNSENTLILDLELDTEYTHLSDPLQPDDKYCKNITVQCREVHQPIGIIYAHPDIATESRHKVFESDFVGWDYLEDLGCEIEPIEYQAIDENIELPVFQINIYAFFAIAELCRIFQGSYLQDIKELLQYSRKNSGIKQGRRLLTYTQQGKKYYDYILMSWFIKLNGELYQVSISIKDTSAIHGKTSYKEFCKNAGYELKYKDNFSKDEKARMFDMYHERSEDFDNYALGDLHNYDALKANEDKFQEIYKLLKLEQYYTPPRLTIGATVAKLFEAGIHKLFGKYYDRNVIINQFCQYGSADKLKRENTTGSLLAKVDGGRCRNNRPIETVHHGLLCDIDISGCYGEGLRTQIYPLGIPCILDYPRGSQFNKFLTLRQFLKKYDREFEPGLWVARVSLKKDYQLKYQQDYLMSWIPPNDISKMVTDSDSEATDQWWEIDNIGLIKIFKNEIHNAAITHDFIQWLDNIATPRQRKELLDNLLVYSAAWYPKSLRVNSIRKLISEHKKYKAKNTTTIKKKGKGRPKVAIQDMCHAWYGINLGDLLVDKLLIERKKHPKKSPLNNLFKLCTNTVYGDMVSPYFKVGNVVVGNNITARARALAWCMEKGFNGWQTITDGCTFDLTKIPVARDGRKINGENSITLYTNNANYHIGYKNLALEVYNHFIGKKLEKVSNGEFLKVSHCMDANKINILKGDYNKLISELAWKHLQQSFQGLDVLHKLSKDIYSNRRIGQFSFEVKGIFVRGTFHGSANYSLTFNDDKIAMRSYSKTPKSIVTLGDELSYEDTKIEPAKLFLLSLVNPNSIPRSKVFIDERVLKINDYRSHSETYFNSRVLPGNTVYHPRILREFSLSQFTFNTYQQYKSWKQEYERLLRKYGQSYEMFFINQDSTVDYQQMIEEVELAIREGKKRFSETKKQASRHRNRYLKPHNEQECLEKTREAIEKLYKAN